MNQSDEISGAVIGMSTQVGGKVVELGFEAGQKITELIGKLIKNLFEMSQKQLGNDLTDLKPGNNKMKNIVSSARKSGDTIVSQDGLSKSDMKILTQKAKENGIPIAFTGKKDAENITVHVRGSDNEMFKKIMTDMVREKLATRPQELSAFKCKDWEAKGLQAEFSKHDLCANWAKTKDGATMCVFEKADKKAIEIARNEFVKNCSDVEKNISVTKDEQGFTVIADKQSGREISFDGIKNREDLSRIIESEFGFDTQKADIVAAKFGEENLIGAEKQAYFSDLNDNPQREFSKIEDNITLENENILASEFDCMRVTPKADGVPKIVFRDNDNSFAVLDPNIMSDKEMKDVLRDSLGINDEKTLDALVDKSNRVQDFYANQNTANLSHTERGTHGEIAVSIDRNSKEKFTVTPTLTDDNGKKITGEPVALSFSDKKKTLTELTNILKKQGMTQNAAQFNAKQILTKAQSQSPEKMITVEKFKAELLHTVESDKIFGIESADLSGKSAVKITDGAKSEYFVNLDDRDGKIEKLSSNFGIEKAQAERVLNRAEEKLHKQRIDEKQTTLSKETNLSEKEKSANLDTQTGANGHEKSQPTGGKLSTKTPVPKADNLPKSPIKPTVTSTGKGGRK
jgi:hypothetical protein